MRHFSHVSRNVEVVNDSMRAKALFAPVLLTGLIGLAEPSPAEPLLTPHAAEYKVRISILSGRLSTRLAGTDDGYEAMYLVQPKGLAAVIAGGKIEATSNFVDTSRGFLPDRHVTADSISRDKIQAALDFDWDLETASGVVTGELNGEDVEQPLDNIVHDFVTLQYEIARDLKNDTIKDEYVLFEPDELKPLSIETVGSDRIEVPYGEFEVIGVRHQRKGSSRTTTFWFAPELDYLPVVIERHRKGKTLFRAVLDTYTASSE